MEMYKKTAAHYVFLGKMIQRVEAGTCVGGLEEKAEKLAFVLAQRLAWVFRITLGNTKDRAKTQLVQQFTVPHHNAEEFVSTTAGSLVSGNSVYY